MGIDLLSPNWHYKMYVVLTSAGIGYNFDCKVTSGNLGLSWVVSTVGLELCWLLSASSTARRSSALRRPVVLRNRPSFFSMMSSRLTKERC